MIASRVIAPRMTGVTAGGSLCTAFTTAILLTGSVKRAEAATLEGIRLSDAGTDADEELGLTTAIAAVSTRYRDGLQRTEETVQASSLLPAELRNVLHLPPDLRQCFVLRLMMAVPREFCARLLGMEGHEVDLNMCQAARALAQVADA